METEAIHLKSVDVDALPGLAVLFGGDLLRQVQRETAKVVLNIQDTTTDPEAERIIAVTLSFVPNADLQSAIMSVRIDTKFSGSLSPKACRLVFRRSGQSLQASVNAGVRTEPAAVPDAVPPVDMRTVPTLDLLFEGALDDAFRRELVRVLLNIDDPRTEAAHKRKITLTLAFKADADRGALSCRLKQIRSHLAGCKVPNPSTLYMERKSDGRLTLDFEPTAFLPDDAGGSPAKQTTLDPASTNGADSPN